jgi:ABC-type arginine transport system permease subunit
MVGSFSSLLHQLPTQLCVLLCFFAATHFFHQIVQFSGGGNPANVNGGTLSRNVMILSILKSSSFSSGPLSILSMWRIRDLLTMSYDQQQLSLPRL